VIVIDTSALMAVALNEPARPIVQAKIEEASQVVVSAATVAELLIVGRRRGLGPEVEAALEGIAAVVVPVTAALAAKVADAYDQWGKGVHPAGLNIMDCFAYALAKERDCPLLFVGDDFARTDVKQAI
jgi:ribonuclease VapC